MTAFVFLIIAMPSHLTKTASPRPSHVVATAANSRFSETPHAATPDGHENRAFVSSLIDETSIGQGNTTVNSNESQVTRVPRIWNYFLNDLMRNKIQDEFASWPLLTDFQSKSKTKAASPQILKLLLALVPPFPVGKN